jgi:hypothetical protein
MDPRSWNANMDATINIGLGTGSRDRDMAMLNQIHGTLRRYQREQRDPDAEQRRIVRQDDAPGAAATATLRRAFVYEYKVGPPALPNATDCEIVWTVIKQTTAGTGGVSLTANAIDQADAASGTVALAR